MFGFVNKFKTDVVSGFDAVHQRLITLEARVEALFNHQKIVAEAAVAPEVKVAEDIVKTVEDSKDAS